MPIGTRVRLASGGPEMIVMDFHPETWRVLCGWSGGEAWFLVVCLDVIRSFHVIED